MKAESLIAVHSLLSHSRANGPGTRSVIWVQGCSIGCGGCFNPSTHETGSSESKTPAIDLFSWILSNGVDGITITGGEPFQQLPNILGLSRDVKKAGLTSIALTGYTLKQVFTLADREQLEDSFDVVVAGPYRQSLHSAQALRGSTNKDFLFLSDAYTLKDFEELPECEVVIEPNGSVIVTGINVPTISEEGDKRVIF